ncbi:MAG: SMP-30/gluconolactonase/LRE family protein, partial [Planctomycetaceae bacterium]
MPRFRPVGLLLVAAHLASFAVRAEEGSVPDLLPALGSIERLDPRFDALVPKDSVIEVLASGFEWAEGPVWVKKEGAILFSDIPRNRVNRWKQGEGLSVFLEPAGFTGPGAYGNERGSNGLTLDRQGNLISCEHGDRRVSRLTPGGGKRTVADNSSGVGFPVTITVTPA